MRKRISGFLSILLVAVMVLSMALTAFAADIKPMSSATDTKFTITVSNAVDGQTYSAYKIFDVTYDDDEHYSYTINSDSVWYDVVDAAKGVFSLTQTADKNVYVVSVYAGVEASEVIAVFTEAKIDLPDTPDGTATAENGIAVIDVAEPGYYYVTTSLGALVMISTADPDAEIREKNGVPTPDKSAEVRTDANGQSIEYTIDVTGIKGAVNLILHDFMDKGLSLQGDETEGYTVTVSLDGKTLVYGKDYLVTLTDDCADPNNKNGCTFEINFTDYDFTSCTNTSSLIVKYTCDVDTKNAEYDNDEYDLSNTAHVSYGYSDSSSKDTDWDVYFFGFEVYKYEGVISEDPTTSEALAGVEFELKNEGGETAYFVEETVDGKTVYLFEGWGTPAQDSSYTQTLITGEDGMIYIEGLDKGVYSLYETRALDGYNVLTGPVTVTITAVIDAGADEPHHTVSYQYGDDEGSGVVNIQNNSGTVLPGTGGMGTTLFYIIGIVFVLGAAVLFVTKKRLEKE